jgi:hypothetical protein
MARPIARDAEEFARLMLQTLEQRGARGEWVSLRELFEQTAALHPQHAYVGLVAAKPARRGALSPLLERLRAAEFPQIERRKEGDKPGDAVLYRSAPAAAVAEPQASVRLDLQLPYEAPASHPLLEQRRALEARREQPSARRSAMTEGVPISPWRRRLLPPRLPLSPGGLEQAWSSVRACWGRVCATVAGFSGGR